VRGMRTLPRDIAPFTGREPELRQLMRVAAGPDGAGGVHTIGGMPGVGKTALAVHAAHLLQDRFPDRRPEAIVHSQHHQPSPAAVTRTSPAAEIPVVAGTRQRQSRLVVNAAAAEH
jgi:hypothetical protein